MCTGSVMHTSTVIGYYTGRLKKNDKEQTMAADNTESYKHTDTE